MSAREADGLKVSDLESKVAALEALTKDMTRRLGERVTRVVGLEKRAEVAERHLGVLSELVGPLLVMVLHADGHHRGENMNSRTMVETVFPPPKWTLWRREEVYEEAREKLLGFLGRVSEQPGSLLKGLLSDAPVTTRAASALRN